MIEGEKTHPYCFGKLECVFPMGKDDMRSSPESCFYCIFKTECLRSAMRDADGLKVREESVDRAYESRMIGFFERWSIKKDLRRRMKKQGANEKIGRGD